MTELPTIAFQETPKRRYLLNDVEVPSVTQVLGVLEKTALPWWGMTVGVKGVCALAQSGEELDWTDPAGIVSLLTATKRTVNHLRDSAATRGKSVHDALEAYATSGTVPRPSEFPAEDRGYVQALARAIVALEPECLATEVMVGSVEHGFAGRYDLLCTIDGLSCRLDLKTGKRIYDVALLQLAGYELAAVEGMGEDPADQLLVLRLDAGGEFELVRSHATAPMFLGILAAYNALAELKASRPRKEKAAA